MDSKEKEKDEKSKLKRQDHIAETASAYHVGKRSGYTLKDYYGLPDERRVELIDGVFYDMSAPTLAHQRAGLSIYSSINEYISQKRGMCVPFAAPVDVQLDCDEDTMVQPDVLVVCDRDKLLNRCVYGAPDLIVEVLSPSTSRKDSILKLAKYRAAGVREYWMVDLDKKKVVVYEFEKGESPVIYGMDQEVPVGIFDGRCRVDFAKLYGEICFLFQ